jgi:hypothetical protein
VSSRIRALLIFTAAIGCERNEKGFVVPAPAMRTTDYLELETVRRFRRFKQKIFIFRRRGAL